MQPHRSIIDSVWVMCRAKLRQPLRAGYIGQITNLANRLLALSIERELISSFLNGDESWESWVRDVLEPTNKVRVSHPFKARPLQGLSIPSIAGLQVVQCG